MASAHFVQFFDPIIAHRSDREQTSFGKDENAKYETFCFRLGEGDLEI